MTLPSHRSLSVKAKRTYASRELSRSASAFPPLAARTRYRSQGSRSSLLHARRRCA
jgi:hypothetical protein